MPTQIVFLGSTKSEPLTLEVDQGNVEHMHPDARGLSRLTRDGKPIWVNFSNVLYLEEAQEGTGVAFV